MKCLLPLALLLLIGCARTSAVDAAQLTVPAGFRIANFADTKASPRVMAFTPGGVLLVTSTSDGSVLALPDANRDGRADRVATILQDLDAPHGIAFYQGKLYVAETGRVLRYDWNEAQLRATSPQAIARVPRGGGHLTRTLLFAKGKMYVSVGSSCNVCEDDEGRAAVHEFNPDGSAHRIFASGTRNAVGLDLSPQTGTVWASENGRDWLGDDLPPDEINDFGKNGGDFGWPYCYGKRVPDVKYSRLATTRCPNTVPSKVDLQAHSAALGMAFYTGKMFPQEYRNDLFVAYHGSWNRSVPTGYKVVRIRLNAQGEPQGTEDFLTGFVPANETRKGTYKGRPAGVAVSPEGALYVSDDSGGSIYRITWVGK
jgi:glucose/arabinose dehydrogenase